MAQWTFFTNHAHILFLVALDPSITVKEIALKVGITERAAMQIISHLTEDGFIKITKVGRRNTYSVNSKKHLRHSIEGDCKVEDIIKMLKKCAKS